LTGLSRPRHSLGGSSLASHCGGLGSSPCQDVVFVVDKVALVQVFSEYFGFPCQFSFYEVPIATYSSSSIIRGWYNKPVSGRRTKWTRSHPTPRIFFIFFIHIALIPRSYGIDVLHLFFGVYTVGWTPWTSDRPVQGLSLITGQHKRRITRIHIKHPCPEWDSNPRSRPPNERRQVMPETARRP
jgi:hypothetical protein